jgi:hypothetical protein
LDFRNRINNLRENFSYYDDSPIATFERPILIFSLFPLLLGYFQDIVHESMIIAFIAMEIADVFLFFFAQILLRFVPKLRAIFASLFRSHFRVSFKGI